MDFLTAAGEATTTDNAGLIPVPFLREVIGVVDSSRPFIDSITRAALPAAGMSFRIPRWQVLPTVDETAELASPSDTMTEIDDLTVDIVKFSGMQRVSIELLERSDPSYLDELLRGLAASYAQQNRSLRIHRRRCWLWRVKRNGLRRSDCGCNRRFSCRDAFQP